MQSTMDNEIKMMEQNKHFKIREVIKNNHKYLRKNLTELK